MLAPIVLFVYNRPWHTQQTVEALQKNVLAEESDLYIFADGPKETATEEQKERIRQVREYIHQITGFKQIIIYESAQNIGCADSIIAGISSVLKEHEKIIVVEDDIVTSRYFLRFMNDALDFYEQDSRIYMIGGFKLGFKIPWWYSHDVFIVHRSCSWGWATWKNRWIMADWNVSDYNSFVRNKKEIDRFCRGGNDMFPMLQKQMEGKIDAWDIRWDYCMYKHNAYCLWPTNSWSNNIGFDGSGVHCENDSSKDVTELHNSYKVKFVRDISADEKLEKSFKDFCSSNHNVSVAVRIKNIAIKTLNKIKGML